MEDFFGASPDWAKERKLPMLSLISFETGRKTQTQSSVRPFQG
jgi:hypothetical protein